jgi:hypothetical protein
VENCCTAEQATDANMVHAHCMLDTEDFKHTLRTCNCNTGLKRLTATLDAHYLSSLKLAGKFDIQVFDTVSVLCKQGTENVCVCLDLACKLRHLVDMLNLTLKFKPEISLLYTFNP